MEAPQSVLDACLRLASEASDDALRLVSGALEGGAQSLVGRLTSDVARHFDELQRVWRDDGQHLSHAEVSCLLRGAAYAVQRERASRRVELVWSGPTGLSSTFRSTGPALLELIESARQAVYLVTFAAYRVPAVVAALDAALKRGVRVVFVLESDESGRISFDPLPYLRPDANSSAEVYCWPQHIRRRDERGRHGTLHAKFAVADRHRLLVSSANLTEFAFDLNIELGVLLTGGTAPGAAGDHVDSLIRTGVLQRQRTSP
jgi:phosphatidylserine/phosphatidylglycerophosphate/cardiolipin synthase-like enzyme